MKKTFVEFKQSLQEIREKLFAVMQKHNLSVLGMAKEIGITHNALNKFLTGQTNPRITLMMKLDNYINEKQAEKIPEDPFLHLSSILTHLDDIKQMIIEENLSQEYLPKLEIINNYLMEAAREFKDLVDSLKK